MKKIKKALLIVLIYLIGIGCIYALCLRAEQIDNHNKVNYQNNLHF